MGYGKAGSFEGFCSGGGIAQLAAAMALEKRQRGETVSFGDGVTAKTVAEAAARWDVLALEVYRVCGEYLGQGLSILIDLFNPQLIVIGSIFARSYRLLWPAAERVLLRETLPLSRAACRVVPAGLGESLGDYATLAVAYEAKGGDGK